MNRKKDHTMEIVVVGSTNMDMVVRTKEMPRPGETVLGHGFLMNHGGKGANQAVAAVRLGSRVGFIGKVGEDVFGDSMISHLSKEGLKVDFLIRDSRTPSGMASIILDENGQNSIVVAPGANAKLMIRDIDNAKEFFKSSKVILLQFEINIETVFYTAKMGHEMGKKIILNPAPCVPFSENIFSFLYAITPNETEAEALTGIEITNDKNAEIAASELRKKGVPVVVITMGEKGAFLSSDEFTGLIPSPKVKVVDTTAAGDTFNGAFAVAVCNGKSLKESVVFANKAAAFSVTKVGAQSSCPYLDDMNESLSSLSNLS